MKTFELNKIAVSFLSPFLFTFTIYLYLNGEVSPGGGFGAGALLATIFIARHFFGIGNWFLQDTLNKILFFAIGGYFVIALLSLVISGSMLNYSFLLTIFNVSSQTCQQIGIMFVETCILLVVFASCYKIFLTFFK
jgi:multicomponent Na+:H+ antiporter subunit B